MRAPFFAVLHCSFYLVFALSVYVSAPDCATRHFCIVRAAAFTSNQPLARVAVMNFNERLKPLCYVVRQIGFLVIADCL